MHPILVCADLKLTPIFLHAKEYKITNLQYTRPHELEADLQEDKLAPQRPLELHTIRIQNNKLRYFRGNFKDTVN